MTYLNENCKKVKTKQNQATLLATGTSKEKDPQQSHCLPWTVYGSLLRFFYDANYTQEDTLRGMAVRV